MRIEVKRTDRKLWILYLGVATASLTTYFATKHFLILTTITNVRISNLTLNLLLFAMTWGALGPYLFRKKSFIVRWLLVLGGFLLILLILTATGTHTRLTDLLGIFEK